MALKLRKDIKKSSYYVWFLGAKESKGLRGSEYIIPVIKHLEEREKDVEPFKVTLQVSHKGLKIIQNIVSQNPKSSKPKNETIKHFIPHNTITCVYQHEDIIACILLLFNPVTKCPLHVHAYRCDSLETATLLKTQLQLLIDKPENQKKFADIEGRLKTQKEIKKVESSIGSDTGTSTRESESSEERYAVENTRVTTLYDSVAAELRAKLGKKNSPILLPPRDYDTVHRTKGNLTGIELRRCLNANIVGQNVKARRIESSGGSSGIGSDHPPSPESPDAPDSRFNTLDNQSTSDEDWNGDPADSTVYLMHQPAPQHHHHNHHQVTLPRPLNPRETSSPEPVSAPALQRFSRYAEPKSPTKQTTDDEGYGLERSLRSETQKYLEKPITKYADNKFLERQKSLEKKTKTFERQKSFGELELRDRLGKGKERDGGSEKYYYRDSEKEVKEKYERYNTSEDRIDGFNERSARMYRDDYVKRSDKEKPSKYFDDDGFDENIRFRSKSTEFERERHQRFSYEDEECFVDNRPYRDRPVPRTRQKYSPAEDKYYNSQSSRYPDDSPKKQSSRHEDSRYYAEPPTDSYSRTSYKQSRNGREERSIGSQEYYDESTTTTMRKNPQSRQRSPSPTDDVKAPRDRFKDAKEKFLLMERERIEKEMRRPESPISPVHIKEKHVPSRRHDNMGYSSASVSRSNYEDRYYDGDHLDEHHRPKPAPRQQVHEEVRYRERNSRERDTPVDRYRQMDKYDPKRRSMFSLIEEEHRKNSNEIAKELKRRSYMEGCNYETESSSQKERFYHDLPESERFIEAYSKSSHEKDRSGETKFVKNQKVTKNAAGYRHSYVEPKIRVEKNGKKHFSEMLHRANSSVGNTGRVGIASVHPY